MELPDVHDRTILARLVSQSLRRGRAVPVFEKPLEQRFEADRREKRIFHLRIAIVLGLFIYNLFNLTDAMLIPDISHFSWAIRSLLLTPGGIVILWLLDKPALSAAWRERIVCAAMAIFALGPLALFHLSEAPTAHLVLVQSILCLFFASGVLHLRFEHAAIVYAVSFAATAAVLANHADMPIKLAGLFMAYTACAVIFGLACTVAIERNGREAYLLSLQERLRAVGLSEDRNKLAILSATDWLTGMANRRSLENRMIDLWAEGGNRDAISMILLDIDHFKRFNDGYGHPAGDRCLRQIASILTAGCSLPGLFLARYGGEEFAVVAKGMSEAELTGLAARLCRDVSTAGIPHRGRADGLDIVTISLGVARVADDDSIIDVGSLVSAADRALYAAKRLGRNRAVRFGSIDVALAEALPSTVSEASEEKGGSASAKALRARKIG